MSNRSGIGIRVQNTEVGKGEGCLEHSRSEPKQKAVKNRKERQIKEQSQSTKASKVQESFPQILIRPPGNDREENNEGH